jgi:hypothetical protein
MRISRNHDSGCLGFEQGWDCDLVCWPVQAWHKAAIDVIQSMAKEDLSARA